jgi:hypothetical protein
VTHKKDNPYLHMHLRRVRIDAVSGVALAIQACQQRDPEGAARVLGPVLEVSGQEGPAQNGS